MVRSCNAMGLTLRPRKLQMPVEHMQPVVIRDVDGSS